MSTVLVMSVACITVKLSGKENTQHLSVMDLNQYPSPQWSSSAVPAIYLLLMIFLVAGMAGMAVYVYINCVYWATTTTGKRTEHFFDFK